MIYQCRDCSYKGQQFLRGSCPACGSNNVGREIDEAASKKKHSRLSLVILALLWGYLIFAIARKLMI